MKLTYCFLRRSKRRASTNKTSFGFGGRFYQSQVISSLDTVGGGTYSQLINQLTVNDTVEVLIHRTEDSTITTRNDLGLQGKVYWGGSLNDNNSLYAFGSAQALRRKYATYRGSTIVESLDTMQIPTSSVSSLPPVYFKGTCLGSHNN